MILATPTPSPTPSQCGHPIGTSRVNIGQKTIILSVVCYRNFGSRVCTPSPSNRVNVILKMYKGDPGWKLDLSAIFLRSKLQTSTKLGMHISVGNIKVDRFLWVGLFYIISRQIGSFLLVNVTLGASYSPSLSYRMGTFHDVYNKA